MSSNEEENKFWNLDEISTLANQLQHSIDSSVVAVDDLIELVKARKIDQLRAIFASQDQRYQCERMFYTYINGRVDTTPRIVYQDKEKFVCLSKSGYNEVSESYYHAAWVIGVAEGQTWIHRLEWDPGFDSAGFIWDEDYIKKKMGFKKELVEGQNIDFIPAEPVRVQGDLILTMKQTFAEYEARHRNRLKQLYEREYDKRIENEIWDAADTQKKAADIQALCQKDIEFLTPLVDNTKKYRTSADREMIERIRERHNIPKERAFLVRDLCKKLIEIKEQAHQSLVDAHTHSDLYMAARNRDVDKRLKALNFEKHLQELNAGRRWRGEDDKTPSRVQINRRMGNHLVIIESGIITDERNPSPTYIVPKDTTAYFIHDEHMNTSVKLPAGVYELGLLTRHRQDRR